MSLTGIELKSLITVIKDVIWAFGYEILHHQGNNAAYAAMNIPSMPGAAFEVFGKPMKEFKYGKIFLNSIKEAAYLHCCSGFPKNSVLTVMAEFQTERDCISPSKTREVRFGREK